MFVTGPDVVKAATGETISMDDLGGGLVHNATSGVAHYLGEDEADAIDYARTVLAYLPSSSDSNPPTFAYAATRGDRAVAERLGTIVPENDRQPYDVLDVIRCIVDYGEFVQVQELFAPSAVVGLACVEGHPVGIVANQPNVNAGVLDVDASEKVARFVRLCDAFNLPVITLVDTPGYKPGAEQEHAGIIRRGAKVIYAYANAQVPMVTVILRKAFGGAYIVMGSKSIGADMNFAWPSSQIAVLGAKGAVNIIHRKELQKAKEMGKDVEALRTKLADDYEATTVNANLSLEMGEIDAMIDPEQTREAIAESLRLLAGKKRVRRTTKHHGKPAAVTDDPNRLEPNRRKGTAMTDTMFFLNRLAAEPHALAFGGQSTPWTVALADQTTDPMLEASLKEHMAAANRLLTPVSADLLAANGRPVDLFGFDANPAKLGPAADAAASVPGIALAQLGALLDMAGLGYDPAAAKPAAVLGHSRACSPCTWCRPPWPPVRLRPPPSRSTRSGHRPAHRRGRRPPDQAHRAERQGRRGHPDAVGQGCHRQAGRGADRARRHAREARSPSPSPTPPTTRCSPATRRTWRRSSPKPRRSTSTRPSCARRRSAAARCSTRCSNTLRSPCRSTPR